MRKKYSEEYKEFKDLLWFFSYISQIFNNYLKKFIIQISYTVRIPIF